MLNLAQAIDKHSNLRYNNIVVDETFLSSSMAEHSAVNRRVVGSSPTWGARNMESESDLVRIFLCLPIRLF